MSEKASAASAECSSFIQKEQDVSHSGRSNFGPRGWSIILMEGIMFWVASGSNTHGLNVIIPTLCAAYGLDNHTLLFLATPATWGSVVASFVCAKYCEKKGAKSTIMICLFATGICFGLLGTWGTVTSFVILFFGVCFFSTGFAYVGGTTLIANWFPQKKSLALGWCTMGQTFSAAIYVPILAWLFSVFGVQYGFWGISVLMFLMIVGVAVFARNIPEEFGCSPDNIPMTAEDIAKSRDEQEAYICPLTTRQLLGMRDVWFMGLASGGVYVVLIGVLSQLVPRLMTMGYDLHTAVLYLAIAAVIGIPGSYFWGWIGQKLGSKFALIFYSVWWIVAVVLNMFEFSPVTLWISLIMCGLSLGGATNLTTAIAVDKFPRGAFIKAFGIIAPIQAIIRCCAYAVLAFGLTYLGGYFGAYALLVVVALINVTLFWLTDVTPFDHVASAQS
ncbi:MAG TPA: MFS transporter [Telmatospirillum sp.]|nr:MFS transporter [Telmatospirillum sp.]